MLCFARQNVSRMMCGEACPADGCGTPSFRVGSFSNRPRSGTASSGFTFTFWSLQISRKSGTKASFSRLQQLEFEGCLHESFVFTTSTVGNWRMSRTKASFSQLEQLEIEGCLAGKLRFHIVNCWNLKDVSYESIVFTSSTVGIGRMSRTKASFSHLQPLEFEGSLAQKLRFHSLNMLSQLQLLEFEGSLARKLRFHIFYGSDWKDVSHEGFVFTSSIVGMSWMFAWKMHEMRFWELEDARNAVFCKTKRVSDDVWGSLSGRRVRNTFV